jgi:type I restriction enzyme, R subunit
LSFVESPVARVQVHAACTIQPAMESEWSTRRFRIDKRLTAAGWDVRGCPPGDTDRLSSYPHCAITEYPTANGPADYTLVNGGQVVGIVEAKKVSTGTMTVLGQAERYSRGLSGTPLEHGEFGVPFLYSTNGEQIWFEDVRQQEYRSCQLAAFHTPAAVAEMLPRWHSSAITASKAWIGMGTS